MVTFREWFYRLQGTLLPGRRDADLEDEIRSHMEMAAEDARRRGLDPAAASRAARIEAGGPSQAMDALRDQRGLPWLHDLGRDVTHGLRTLRRTPVCPPVRQGWLRGRAEAVRRPKQGSLGGRGEVPRGR